MLKELLENIKNRIRISELWPEIKTYIQEGISMGKIVAVLDKQKEKWWTCPNGMPVEYCSKENIEVKYVIITDMGYVFTIKQICYGLNFEAPCDSWRYLIYDSNDELLFDSANPGQERKMTVN